MSTPPLVTAFYERIWNGGDLAGVSELLAPDLEFRGSLGAELRGREAFREYVTSTRTALSGYRCEILDCVSEGDRAFARLRFSGRHVGLLRGRAPSGKHVSWLAAALFQMRGPQISSVWVLGDMAALDTQLEANQR